MDTDQLVRTILAAARNDGCLIIEPHREPFRNKQRSFLDGLRTSPSRISYSRPGDPFQRVLNENGRWMMIWIPD